MSESSNSSEVKFLLTTGVKFAVGMYISYVYFQVRNKPYRKAKTETVDLLVAGFGASGAAAVMQANHSAIKDDKPLKKILLIDRFEGGGATARSGGIVYFGGGTDAQKHLGLDDTPENMFNYLSKEVGDSVLRKTLWRFCHTSAQTAAWLRDSFDCAINAADDTAVLCPFKTSNAPEKYSLYYSGSETAFPYKTIAKPVPRGHKTMGKSTSMVGTGNVMFAQIERAVLRLSNVEFRPFTKVVELIMKSPEHLEGVKVASMQHAPFFIRFAYHMLGLFGSLTNPCYFLTDAYVQRITNWLERTFAEEMEIYPKKGFILATGGFCRNQQMVKTFCPPYDGCMPIGCAGDDGFGIFELGMKQAKAHSVNLDRASCWKFIVPAAAMAKGILCNHKGERVVNEDVYGARLTENTMRVKGHGVGWLVMDDKIVRECLGELRTGEMLLFQKAFTLLNTKWNRMKAQTLEELALKTKMDLHILQQTISQYNKDASKKQDTQFGKDPKLLDPITSAGPFYAINYSTLGTLFPSPFLTLGGLALDENTGLVLSAASKRPIRNFYAAGRVASGVCAKSYVSGLSLADCFFSGRRAAEHAIRGVVFGEQYDDINNT